MNPQSKRSLIRNIILLGIASASAGWIGLALNRALGLTDPTQNLGMLIFLLLPPLAGLLLRAFGGDGWGDIGWKPNLRGRLPGYAITLLAYPIIIALVLAVGYLARGITFAGFAAQGVGAFSKLTAWVGVATHGLDLLRMLVDFFFPAGGVALMMVAGPLYLAWFPLLAWDFRKLARP